VAFLQCTGNDDNDDRDAVELSDQSYCIFVIIIVITITIFIVITIIIIVITIILINLTACRQERSWLSRTPPRVMSS